jgi:thioredoxin 2
MDYILSVCGYCESLNRVEATTALAKKPTCGSCGKPLPMHGLATEVSAVGLKKIISKADKPVVVDFWAGWCAPCKVYGPNFERASTKHPEAIFVKVDTEKNPQLSADLGIRGIPTTVVFKEGKECNRQSGALPEEMISQLLR